MRSLLILFCFVFGSSNYLFSQSIGDWKTYTSFRTVIDGATVNNDIWTLTSGGIAIYTDSILVKTITPIDGLSRLDGTSIAYDNKNNQIFVGYIDGLIDVIDVDDFSIKTLSDIQRNVSYIAKKITDIEVVDDRVFVATGFGIVEYEASTLFVIDTYTKFGQLKKAIGVNDIFVSETSFVIATEEGIATTFIDGSYSETDWISYNSNNGFIDNSIRSVGSKGNLIYASSTTDNYVYDGALWSNTNVFGANAVVEFLGIDTDEIVALTSTTIIYIDSADNIVSTTLVNSSGLGLFKQSDNFDSIYFGTLYAGFGEFDKENSNVAYLDIEGPFTNRFQGITITDGILISGSTRVSSRTTQIDRTYGYYIYKEGVWQNYNYYITDVLKGVDIRQVFSTTITDKYYYFGTWGRGVIRHSIDDNEIHVFDETNSTLRGWASDNPNYPVITGIDTDNDGDVWLVSRFGSTPLYVQTPGDDDWKQFNPNSAVNSSDLYENLFIDSNNQKWIPLQNSSNAGTGLLVLDTGNKDDLTDDKGVKLNSEINSGNLPDNKIKAIVEDKNGEIWVGTERGIARFLFPDLIIEGGSSERKAQWLINEDTSAVSRYLLRDVSVTTMAVNDANEKWIGSDGQGLWLINAEGSKILKRFTTDNSPLFSNNIISIAIDDETGEVFISTDVGMISYLDAPKKGVVKMKDLKVYPNPFSYSKHSSIIIDGLAESTSINVIGVDGTVVNSLEAEGGRITWNGFDYNGNRLGTGVYYVVAIGNNDSTGKGIGKVIIVN